MDKQLGKLTKITNFREYWPHEALNFTPWLAEEDNIALLGDAIGMDIVVDETESPVGSFNVDILAREMNTDRIIIIENQLEETDHDHLGKILTYASGKDANYVVWVVRKARDEHRRAIEWLNNKTDDSIGFFLVELELWSIDHSAPAARFQVVEQPNGWVKEIKRASRLLTDGAKQKNLFWNTYVDFAFSDPAYTQTFRCRKPGVRHWYDLIPSEIRDFSLSLLTDTRKKTIGVEIYIENNKDLFRYFHGRKTWAEDTVGTALEWLELPERKSSRIVLRREAQLEDQQSWEEYFSWMKKNSLCMLHTFQKLLDMR